MANQGKRMVKENLIAEIGQGTTYTAGTGIDITGSTISVDSETVAMVSSLATVATTGDYTDLINTPTITVVSANTGATPSATLTDLDIDGTVYEVPQGGGGSTEVAIGWVPDGETRTDYNFSTDNLASLIALGLPIIATADTTNYPLNSNITIGKTYKLYGAALIVRDSTRYRVVLVGSYDGTTSKTSWLYANNYDNQQVYIKGIFEANLSNSNLATTYIGYGTSIASASNSASFDTDTILALPEPVFVADDNSISFNAGNSYFNNTVVDAMKGIRRINITPMLDDVGNNNNNVSSLTFAFNANLKNNPLSGSNQVYINTVSTDGSKNYTYGFKNYRTDFIDTNIVPDASLESDGTYVLEATVASGVVTYAWVLKQ